MLRFVKPILPAFLACGFFTSTIAAAPAYRVVHRFSLPGDGKWDCLASDTANGRLFLSHGDEVQVMDEATGTLLGAIPDAKGAHSIALAEDLCKGFISNGKDTSVTIFALKDLKTLAKVKVTGLNPDGLAYDAFSRRVFAFNGKSANATVLDAADGKIVSTIALEGKPEMAAVDGHGKLFIHIEDKSRIDEIDTKALQETRSWPLAPGESPSGIALDAGRGLLFSACDNKLMAVSDIASGKAMKTLPIGSRVDGAAFDPALKRAYSSNGDGTLTVIQEDDRGGFSVIGNFATQQGARTIALDQKTHHLFLPTAEFFPAPKPTPENPKARPEVKPGTFVILDVAPVI